MQLILSIIIGTHHIISIFSQKEKFLKKKSKFILADVYFGDKVQYKFIAYSWLLKT